jgi:hypothetical protein
MVEWIGMHHDEGKSFAGDFVVDFQSVGGAVGHDATSVNISYYPLRHFIVKVAATRWALR